MRKFYFLLILIFCLKGYAQKKTDIYVDENLKYISETQFCKKKESPLYYGFNYSTKDTLLSRLFLSYDMGKLNKKSKNQLFSLLSQRNNVDTTRRILIHYRDTLFSKNNYPRIDSILYSSKNHLGKNSYESFIQGVINCENEENGNDIKVYHFYKHNQGHPKEIKEVSFNQDHLGMVNRLFHNTDGLHRYWAVLIFPDGRYIRNNRIFRGYSPINWQRLKKGKGWKENFLRFKRSYSKLN